VLGVRDLAMQAVAAHADVSSADEFFQVRRRMQRTEHPDADGFADGTFGCGPGRLDVCLITTPQVGPMSSKSAASQSARLDRQAWKPDPHNNRASSALKRVIDGVQSRHPAKWRGRKKRLNNLMSQAHDLCVRCRPPQQLPLGRFDIGAACSDIAVG